MPTEQDLFATVTRLAAALREADVRFALAAGCAAYARGAPPTEHDVDIILRPADADTAVEALVAAGMRAHDPPEDWLTKVYDGEVLVDLLFRPNERPVTDAVLDRAEDLRFGPVLVPVQTATDVLIGKVLVLGPQRGDVNEPLTVARALREQVDWAAVATEAKTEPYVSAFLHLAVRLGVAPENVDAGSGIAAGPTG